MQIIINKYYQNILELSFKERTSLINNIDLHWY